MPFSRTDQAGNYPVLLIDGAVAGVWHLRQAGRRGHLTVESLWALSARHRKDLEKQAGRIGAALACDVDLTMGKVEVGPHA